MSKNIGISATSLSFCNVRCLVITTISIILGERRRWRHWCFALRLTNQDNGGLIANIILQDLHHNYQRWRVKWDWDWFICWTPTHGSVELFIHHSSRHKEILNYERSKAHSTQHFVVAPCVSKCRLDGQKDGR
jgi:hypothetical protein